MGSNERAVQMSVPDSPPTLLRQLRIGGAGAGVELACSQASVLLRTAKKSTLIACEKRTSYWHGVATLRGLKPHGGAV